MSLLSRLVTFGSRFGTFLVSLINMTWILLELETSTIFLGHSNRHFHHFRVLDSDSFGSSGSHLGEFLGSNGQSGFLVFLGESNAFLEF